jgi:hypothetical protein
VLMPIVLSMARFIVLVLYSIVTILR